jgi:UDP-glucose 4-epimerase
LKHPEKTLITGGAGFIGSHLVDRLMQQGHKVTALDNLSNGSLGNLQRWINHPRFKFIKADLKNQKNIARVIKGHSSIFHFAANPEVRVGETNPQVHFEENLMATFNLLEAVKRTSSVKTLVFASTSTVYGQASVLPTPETYAPLIPISTYGASKLGCEALISSYAHSFSFRALIIRMANIVGPRSNHGVIIDFVKKLKADSSFLEILGDGTQNKSYMYIADCIEAIIQLTDACPKENVEIFNLGSTDQINVKRIADIIVGEMQLSKVQYLFRPGAEDGAGWKGDVKNMQLSIGKLTETGWKPKYASEQAVRLTTRSLLPKTRSC